MAPRPQEAGSKKRAGGRPRPGVQEGGPSPLPRLPSPSKSPQAAQLFRLHRPQVPEKGRGEGDRSCLQSLAATISTPLPPQTQQFTEQLNKWWVVLLFCGVTPLSLSDITNEPQR